MFQLIFVSFLWAFSFGLIKSQLTGLDSNLVAAIRLFISFIIFLPFLKLSFQKKIGRNNSLFLCMIGAIQFGIMYVCYIKAYQYLKSYEVALFTIFTPFYISLFSDVITRSFTPRNFIAAFLAIIGGLVVAYTGKDISVKMARHPFTARCKYLLCHWPAFIFSLTSLVAMIKTVHFSVCFI